MRPSHGRLAQLVRASVSHTEGHRFESCTAHHLLQEIRYMGQYDKYICTTLQKRHMLPGPTPEQRDKLAASGKRISMEHILWVDNEVIPGAYYGETTFIWPSSYPGQITREEQ